MLQGEADFTSCQVERAIHIHAQVHTNWTVESNGTIIRGSTVSTGQIFIGEELEKQIMALEPYASHTEIERVQNDDDGIFLTESDSEFPLSVSICDCLLQKKIVGVKKTPD